MPHAARFSGFSRFTPTAQNFHAISLLQNRNKDKRQGTGLINEVLKLSTGAQQRTQAKGIASTILSGGDFGDSGAGVFGGFGSSGAGVGRGTVAFKTLSGF